VLGADAAWVGEGDRVALEVGGGELVGPRAVDDVFIPNEEFVESHLLGALDPRYEECSSAVGLGQVDRDAEVDVHRCDD